MVSIHAPVRGATVEDPHNAELYVLQSTRPQGARRRPTRSPPSTVCCFNPRARKGRNLACSHVFAHRRFVSIHAPARGATGRHASLHGGLLVSIHAPARGATVGNDLIVYGAMGFNPRARKGRDLAFFRLGPVERVSIHAPARGATS